MYTNCFPSYVNIQNYENNIDCERCPHLVTLQTILIYFRQMAQILRGGGGGVTQNAENTCEIIMSSNDTANKLSLISNETVNGGNIIVDNNDNCEASEINNLSEELGNVNLNEDTHSILGNLKRKNPNRLIIGSLI